MFFFQAEDGIRDRSPSRGLGDVYKRQTLLGVMDRAVRGAVEDEAAKYTVVIRGAQSGQQRVAGQAGVQVNGGGRSMYQFQPVSYTHLTLPTICSV